MAKIQKSSWQKIRKRSQPLRNKRIFTCALMETKLVEIKKAERVIFIGDTHGDLKASQLIIKNYLICGNKIVFLGDYVDRGPFSKENLEFLLKTKLKFPNQIFLLQGNHEGHRILKFSPAEFWQSLDKTDYLSFSTIVENTPLAIVTKDIIALHGALPNVESLEKINEIKIGDENWFRICWGDFVEEPGEDLGIDPFTGRPQFGRDYFLKLMERFGKKILIRSHQPDCPQFMFNDRCLTIFTSSAYPRERTIAILDLNKKIKTAKDLEIRKI
jgi:predicted phosphodiesterase